MSSKLILLAVVLCLPDAAPQSTKLSVIDRPTYKACKSLADCGIVDARLLCAPPPEFPKLAEIANIRGEVKMLAIVSEDGSVHSLNLITGHPFLVPAAMEAAKRYRFEPATAHGVPIKSAQLIAIRFGRSVEVSPPCAPQPFLSAEPQGWTIRSAAPEAESSRQQPHYTLAGRRPWETSRQRHESH